MLDEKKFMKWNVMFEQMEIEWQSIRIRICVNIRMRNSERSVQKIAWTILIYV